MKNYLITGTAGSGKSTICEALANRGYRVLEFDGAPSEKVIFRKEYRKKFDKRTGQPSSFARGNGWDELQYVDWRVDRDKLLPDLEGPDGDIQFVSGYANNWQDFRNDFDGIFLLEVSRSTTEKRLLNRTAGDWGRKHPEELRHTLETASEFNNLLKKHGAISINAEQPVEEIVNYILATIGSKE